MNRNLSRLRDVLARAWPDVPPALPSDRRRLVTAVEMALARRARRTAVERRAFQALLACAAAVLLVATGWEVSHYVDVQRGVVAERGKDGEGRARDGSSRGGQQLPDANALHVLQAPEAGAAGGAVITRSSTDRGFATEGMALEAGQVLEAPATAEVRIGSARGTSLTLEPDAQLSIGSLGKMQTYALGRGAVRTRVARLEGDERFIIATADGEIEVHGTAFRVSLADSDASCGGGVRTRVAVSEGVVSVRSRGIESFLAAGEEWPRGCTAMVTATAAPPSTETATGAVPVGALTVAASEPGHERSRRHLVHRPHRHRRVHRHAGGSTRAGARSSALDFAESQSAPSERDARGPATDAAAAVAPASSLSTQNDLFAAATRAKNAGRTPEAVRLFSELIDRYPESPLLESAMVQRLRAMRDADPQGLSAAVAEYLARFPNGFARAEARRLANELP